MKKDVLFFIITGIDYWNDDEKLGEEVAAVIVAADGHGPESAEDVLRHLSSRLAAFKVPSKVFWHHEELPRNAAGKVLKKDLRDLYS
jgi:acyl-CoA synthetase (AMP-forming)/AMP-acid ligase II